MRRLVWTLAAFVGIAAAYSVTAQPPRGDDRRGPGGDDRGPGRGPGGPGRGPGGDDRGPGGPGGRGPGGRPQPGQILPPGFADQLKLSNEQRKQLEALQKDVDARLAKILTEDQKKQIAEMRDRGPGGRGPGGRGPGGDGPGRGPGGRGPGGDGPGRGPGGDGGRPRPDEDRRP